MRYLVLLSILLVFSGGAFGQSAAIEKLVVNKYWQYSNTVYDENKRAVYNFKAISGPKEIKEIALLFNSDKTFKEVVKPGTRPKPPRTGTWGTRGDTLILNFPGQSWNYKILYMNATEFQCVMSKRP